MGRRSAPQDDETYKLFKLKNRELAFDVDVSALDCGVNGAVYFVSMDGDGGAAKYDGNAAGAKYGTGYCDAQCPNDAKFINGESNTLNWTVSDDPSDNGYGHYGSCCTEMDIWEANSLATAYTAHSCSVEGQTRCEADDCGDGDARYSGLCDADGCDLQTYRLGNETFYGPGAGFAVDTTRPFTLVTQFITADGTDDGALTEIRRHYRQDGRRVDTPAMKVPGGDGASAFDSLSTEYCEAELDAFGGNATFLARGGMGAMDGAFEDGVVFVLSLWDDSAAHMLWLDSTYPVNSTDPGAVRGPCATDSGDPDVLEPGSRATVT